MEKVKNSLKRKLFVTMLAATMAVSAFANVGISAQAARIHACPACMSRNIETKYVTTTYDYVGQTMYAKNIYFDFCRDCGFRTGNY